MDNSSGSSSNSGPPYTERRSVPRYTFIASVEIVEPASDMHISGRIAEISRKGCYVDILNTLPVGTLLNIRISRDQGAFVTKGKIIYAQEGIGMGVVFLDPSPDQLKILDAWLAELSS